MLLALQKETATTSSYRLLLLFLIHSSISHPPRDRQSELRWFFCCFYDPGPIVSCDLLADEMGDAFEDEAEQTVTIKEYIEGIEAEELEADLVLGGDEGKECTYPNGYMKRQAVFSCLTCSPGGNAGVCTACSLACHDGHEVVELWTKRNFRCDCGNSKFGGFSCKICPNKEHENVDNTYNQNFIGRYCICVRPYPDPDAQEQVEMIQCCICEDWFHENHLGLDSTDEIPRDEEIEPLYEDFICQECALTCSFLKLYPPSTWARMNQSNVPESPGKESSVDSSSILLAKSKFINDSNVMNGSLMNNATTYYEPTKSESKDQTQGETSSANYGLEEDKSFGSNGTSQVKCILGLDVGHTTFDLEKKPMFLSKKWRDMLCRCSTCTNFYKQKGLCYLIDNKDSLEEYENMAKQKREEKLQQEEGAEMNFLDKLNHVQKIEIMRGIADLKNEFHSFLESFDTSKAITSADVQGLFEKLAKKRQRLS
ncbi:hypothetical protein HPP92_026542 [Vanilla planifolia]|uniref:UBR-type domain-containing protein n=1 Tax=Vanilla planifolia TaxID=51239 RepID=A0A835U6V7_VANPL|nr:hypothetical protein HPP92_026770 [Vanilla planifolia]KAG0450819.1 hypothetical protein HPP92_026542 [Vanilla planifolia]